MKRPVSTPKHSLNRRSLVVGALQLGFPGALAPRLRHLQITQADQYRLLAEENRINIRLIDPERGEIYDRNGVFLARNEQSYRITLVKEDAGDVRKLLVQLAQLITLSAEDIERSVLETQRSAPFLPVTIIDRVSWEDIAKVAINAPSLPGITPEVGLSRHYPLGPNFAHIVGYVGPVSDRDLNPAEDPDPLLRIPRFQIGKVGVEAKYEEDLRGRAGAKHVEVNAQGRVMRELERREGNSGRNLQITVDAGLQNYVQARLGEESASAVVMDCNSGDILAIDRIKAIHQRLPNTHLVMHGSSSVPQELLQEINAHGGEIAETYGVPVEEIQQGIKHGVRKVNIDTDLRLASTASIRKFLTGNPSEFDPRKYLAVSQQAMKDVVVARYEAFGTAGHADKIQAKSLDAMFMHYAAGELTPLIA